MYKFIEGIPVKKGTKAEEVAKEFQKWLRERGLKGVYYSTGTACGAWSLDVYIIPENEEKPMFQRNCRGTHLISKRYGYFARGVNNQIIEEVLEYMERIGKVQDQL